MAEREVGRAEHASCILLCDPARQRTAQLLHCALSPAQSAPWRHRPTAAASCGPLAPAAARARCPSCAAAGRAPSVGAEACLQGQGGCARRLCSAACLVLPVLAKLQGGCRGPAGLLHSCPRQPLRGACTGSWLCKLGHTRKPPQPAQPPASPFSWCVVLSVDSVLSSVAPSACGNWFCNRVGASVGCSTRPSALVQRWMPAGQANSGKRSRSQPRFAPFCACGCAPSHPARPAAAQSPADTSSNAAAIRPRGVCTGNNSSHRNLNPCMWVAGVSAGSTHHNLHEVPGQPVAQRLVLPAEWGMGEAKCMWVLGQTDALCWLEIRAACREQHPHFLQHRLGCSPPASNTHAAAAPRWEAHLRPRGSSSSRPPPR